jgi:hypothetical protein
MQRFSCGTTAAKAFHARSRYLAGSRLFTIGHSNHETARLTELLRAAGVTAVADVRSQPFSQRYTQFNRPELQRSLADVDIVYAFLGRELGGRPSDSSLYDLEGRVNYERVRQTKAFREGIERLRHAVEDFTVALLCSEEDPLVCHRGLMIAPALVEEGILPNHLRGDGTTETTAQFEDRLLAETKIGLGIVDGLFADVVSEEERRNILVEAYRAQARRKSFRLRADSGIDSVQQSQDDPE